jgi:hypothetical protein
VIDYNTRTRTAPEEMISWELDTWKERTRKAQEEAANAIARAEMWENRAKAVELQLALLQREAKSGCNTMMEPFDCGMVMMAADLVLDGTSARITHAFMYVRGGADANTCIDFAWTWFSMHSCMHAHTPSEHIFHRKSLHLHSLPSIPQRTRHTRKRLLTSFVRQDSIEGRKQEETAREHGVKNAQKLQERKILEQQEELRRQEEQKKLISEIKQTTQVLELQVAAV